MPSLRKFARRWREIAGLCGVCLLALMPIYFLGRAQWVRMQNSGPIAKFGNPWKNSVSEQVWESPRIALSPNEHYIAALCADSDLEPTPTPTTAPTPAPTVKNDFPSKEFCPPSKELIIWRVADRREVAREKVKGMWNLRWSQRGNLIAADDEIWIWSAKTETLTSLVSALPLQSTDVLSAWSNFDGDLVLQQQRQSGEFQAFRISTAKQLTLAPRIAQRLEGLKPSSQNAKPAAATTPVPPLPVAANLLALAPQTYRQPVIVAFSRSLQAPQDDPYFKAVHPVSVACWNLSGGTRIWERTLTTRYHPPSLIWSPDGSMIALVGTTGLKDGGAATPAKAAKGAKGNSDVQDNRIQIVDATTGKKVSEFAMLNPWGSLAPDDVQWCTLSAGEIVVIADWQADPKNVAHNRRLLRFFDALTGVEIKRWDVTEYWPLDGSVWNEPPDARQSTWSMDRNGEHWALATTQDGLRVFPTALFAPLPELHHATATPPSHSLVKTPPKRTPPEIYDDRDWMNTQWRMGWNGEREWDNSFIIPRASEAYSHWAWIRVLDSQGQLVRHHQFTLGPDFLKVKTHDKKSGDTITIYTTDPKQKAENKDPSIKVIYRDDIRPLTKRYVTLTDVVSDDEGIYKGRFTIHGGADFEVQDYTLNVTDPFYYYKAKKKTPDTPDKQPTPKPTAQLTRQPTTQPTP